MSCNKKAWETQREENDDCYICTQSKQPSLKRRCSSIAKEDFYILYCTKYPWFPLPASSIYPIRFRISKIFYLRSWKCSVFLQLSLWYQNLRYYWIRFAISKYLKLIFKDSLCSINSWLWEEVWAYYKEIILVYLSLPACLH